MLKNKIIGLTMVLCLAVCGTSFISTKVSASTTNDITKISVSRSTSSFSYDIAKFYKANGDLISESPDTSSDQANYDRYKELRRAGRIVSRTSSVIHKEYEEGGTGNYYKIVRYYVTYR
ncbi:hypothetical protein [Clostridium cibarium]|uniref:Uncharacterized protein n=1 Tax=Clostridium cibarium TaxID=2762247 RepID=A0ABR8PSS3_9CLOT|nr:hypothetical protein [Clostridium cibarium]MBD7911217.1 hypothetical protein [Clostridium cibarium]